MKEKEIFNYRFKVFKLTFARAYRDFKDKLTVICSLKKIIDVYKTICFGHPVDIETKECFAGEIGLNYRDDEIEISPISEEEFQLWISEYQKFHNEIIEEKGYDTCIENTDKLSRLSEDDKILNI